MRLIFFLEESPYELRSLVEFLNGQLKETEVLLVEAKLYESSSGRIVVPWLFGYTEQARVAKRESRTQASRGSAERGEEAYRTAVAQSDIPERTRVAISALLGAWPSGELGAPHWLFAVNAIFIVPILPKRGLFHLGRNGDLSLYLGYWNPDSYGDVGPSQVALRDRFIRELVALLKLQISEKQIRSFPTIKAAQWTEKCSELVLLLKRICSEPNAA